MNQYISHTVVSGGVAEGVREAPAATQEVSNYDYEH